MNLNLRITLKEMHGISVRAEVLASRADATLVVTPPKLENELVAITEVVDSLPNLSKRILVKAVLVLRNVTGS